MYESNIDWILAIASLLAGVGIGVLGYHLLNANVARNQKVRQRLAETELELSQVKDALNDHFVTSSELVRSIQRQSHELEQQLAQGAERLCDDLQLKRRLTHAGDAESSSADSDESDASTAGDPPQIPRDYADGNRGTLSENFGLTPKNEDDAHPAQPARY